MRRVSVNAIGQSHGREATAAMKAETTRMSRAARAGDGRAGDGRGTGGVEPVAVTSGKSAPRIQRCASRQLPPRRAAL